MKRRRDDTASPPRSAPMAHAESAAARCMVPPSPFPPSMATTLVSALRVGDDVRNSFRVMSFVLGETDIGALTVRQLYAHPKIEVLKKEQAPIWKELEKTVHAYGPVEVDIEQYLNGHLNNKDDRADMPLQGRDEAMSQLRMALEAAQGRGHHSGKPSMVLLFSTQGSGKTQLMKHFISRHLANECHAGLVLVRDAAQLNLCVKQTWTEVRVSALLQRIVEEHMGEVYRTHVADVGSLSLPSLVEKWTSLAADHSVVSRPASGGRPVLFLDTSELLQLAVTERCHARSPQRPYTLLEHLATLLPVGCVLVAFGTLEQNKQDDIYCTMVHVARLDPLPSLSVRQFCDAVKDWKRDTKAAELGIKIDEKYAAPILHFLAGGHPRLLRSALTTTPLCPLDVLGAWPHLLKRFSADVPSNNVLPDDHAAFCVAALVAAVKYPVDPHSQIPFSQGERYRDLAVRYLCVEPQRGGRAPPGKVIYSMAPKWVLLADRTVSASSVPTWPRGVALKSLVMPFELDDVARAVEDPRPATRRGRPWERLLVHALVARYWIAVQEEHKSAQPWCPLTAVLGQGHDNPVLQGLEVNLQHGLVQPEKEATGADEGTLTWNGHPTNAHHDFYLWVRRKDAPSSHFSIAVQARHGKPKSATELAPQSRQKRHGDTYVECLLYVHNGKTSVDTSGDPDIKALVSQGRFAEVDGTVFARDAAVYALAPFTTPQQS